MQGRFHQLVHVPPPSDLDRTALAANFCSRFSLDAPSATAVTARLRDGMSGADVENLCREAAMANIRVLVGGGSPAGEGVVVRTHGQT